MAGGLIDERWLRGRPPSSRFGRSDGKRILIWAAGVTVITVVSLACMVIYGLHCLSFYRLYIEREYASQLALIERHCLDVPFIDLGDSGDSIDERLDKREAIEKAIGKSLCDATIFSASWSLDGHHGLRSLKRLPTGCWICTLAGSHDADMRRSLYYGKSDDNRNLLAYKGRVPGGTMGHYQIMFLLDQIKKAANIGQPQTPPTADQLR